LGEIPPGDIKWVSAMSFRRDTEDSFQMNRERQAHSLRIADQQETISSRSPLFIITAAPVQVMKSNL